MKATILHRIGRKRLAQTIFFSAWGGGISKKSAGPEGAALEGKGAGGGALRDIRAAFRRKRPQDLTARYWLKALSTEIGSAR